jgi:UDP-glucose 4-epimerase
MLRILITGGKGFIASHLANNLSSEFKIFSPGRDELDLLDSDAVYTYLENNNFDVIIHAATYDAVPPHSQKDPSKILEYNLRMFFNLVRCKIFYSKFIYFGSGAEYSRENWIPNMPESYFDTYVPSEQYSFSKYLMTKYTLYNHNIYNLRLFCVFGKGEDHKVRIISSIYHDILHNDKIIIRQNRKYDFIYIDDLIKVVRWFIYNSPQHNVFNVCSGQPVDFITIANKLSVITKTNKPVIVEDDVQGPEYSGNNKLLLSTLQYFKFMDINKSLRLFHASMQRM